MGPVPVSPFYDKVGGFFSVTNDSTAIGWFIGSSGFYAMTWNTMEGFKELPTFEPGQSTAARYSDPEGRFLPGYVIQGGHSFPVIWIDREGPFKLFDVPSPYLNATATGVSWDGTVITGDIDIGFSHIEAWLMTPQHGLELLGDLSGGKVWSFGSQLPRDGDVILSASDRGLGQEGARWTREKGWEALGDLPGGAYFSNLGRCSRGGRVGAGRGTPASGTTHMARWTEANGWQDLGGAGWSGGVSGDGWTVVGVSGSMATGNLAAMWDPVMGLRYVQDVLENEYGLNLAGWKLREAHAVSDNGNYIAGIGFNPQGKLEGWLVEIPPFCYADCDRSSGKGVLDLFDFLCFVSRFNARDPYGNCDNDGAFDLFDFLCFLNHFNAACP